MTQGNFKIGDTVFTFNENRRVYVRDEKGNSFGSPIYREHFEEHKILGEEDRSWLYGKDYSIKISKIKATRIFFTKQEMDDSVWHHDNAYKLGEHVRKLSPDIQRKVADMTGYRP